MADGSKMKSTLVSILTWCLHFGLLDASYNVFLPKCTHKYGYYMMVTTSTSSGDPQYAAIAFNITVRVDTVTNDRAIMKFEDIKVAKVNDELRKTALEDSKLEFKQIPEYTRNLSRPFEVTYKDGKIERIAFSDEDDISSREMKKAFAQTTQVYLEGKESHNELRRNSNQNSRFYRVMEPCLSGICETQYILKRLRDPSCPDCKVLNVTKIRDYHKCDEKVYFLHSNHPSYKCSACEADASHPISKNTIASFNLKWQDGNYLMQTCESTGIIKISPLGEKSDQYKAVFNKTIELLSVHPLSSPMEARTERAETLVSTMTEKLEKAIRDPQGTDPIAVVFPYKLATAEKISVKLDEVAETIERDSSKKSWRSSLSSIILLLKALRQCTYNELDTIMTHVTDSSHGRSPGYAQRYSEEDESRVSQSWDAKRALYLDLLAQSGTYPALLLWKKYTLDGKITPTRSLNFIEVFTSHCMFPRPQILEIIMEMMKSDIVRQNEQLFSTIVMSYGVLVSRTCLRYKPYWHNPVEPAVLCPEPQRYLQPLFKLLEEVESPGKKMAVLNALGQTRLPDAVMPLKQYATGEATDCDIIQTEAVIALGKCAKLHPSIAKDILYSVFYNIEEAPKVRIAALVGLFKTDLNRHAMEKLAMFTWEEPDTTVGTFVVKSLEAIANSSHPCFSNITNHAQHALNLIDDSFDDGLPLVYNIFFEQELPEFDIVSLLIARYVSDGHPLAPKIAYARYVPHIAGYPTDLLKLSFFGSGTKSLLDQLVGPVSAFSEMGLADILKSVDRPNPNVGLKELAEKLGIKPREDDETKGVLKIAVLGTQQRMFYYNKEKLAKLASSYGSNIWRTLQQGHEFEFQRTIIPLDMHIVVPTPVGLPLSFCVKSPIHYGIKGRIIINLDGSVNNFNGLKVDLKLKPTLAMKLQPSFGVVVPQEKLIVGATYNTMAIFKPTIAGQIQVRKDSHNLSVIIKPNFSTQETTILSFSTHPMTFLYKYDSFKPIFETTTPITFLDKPKELEYPIGFQKHSPIVVKMKHDSFWNSGGSVYDWVTRIADPSSLPLAWLTQSWKNRAYQVVVDPTAISNPEVELKLNWECSQPESLPQKRVLRGWRGLLTYLVGWASTEEKCTSELDLHTKPWEMRRRMQSRAYGTKPFVRDSRHDSSEEDSDEDSVWNERRSKSLKSQYRNSNEDESSEETYNTWYTKLGFMPLIDPRVQLRGSMFRTDRDGERRHDFDVRITDSNKGVSRFVVQAELIAHGEETHKLQANLVLQKHHDAPIQTMSLTVNTPGKEIQQVCLKSTLQYPRVSCDYGGELPTNREKEFRSEVLLQWGRDCSSPSGFVDVKIVANKSHEQVKIDPTPATADIKPWYYAQCERDRVKGIPYSDECILAVDHLAKLNHITLVATYDQIPAVARNISHQLALATNAWLYPYLSYNPIDIQHPEKTIKLVLDYHYDMRAVDAKVYTPTYKAFFAKLNYNVVSRLLQAPNIRKPTLKKIANILTDYGAVASAVLSGDRINTFDNQTYVYKHWGHCKHVLVMDCTTSNMFAILNKPVGLSNKTLIVRVLKHEFEIDATAIGSEREFIVNGEPQKISNDQRAFVYDKTFNLVVAYIHKIGYRYAVTLPQVGLKIWFDSFTTIVKMSRMWQGKVCGLFGDYDNDFIYEYRGPKQCAFTEGAEMAKAYAIPDSSCTPPSVSRNRLCEMERN